MALPILMSYYIEAWARQGSARYFNVWYRACPKVQLTQLISVFTLSIHKTTCSWILVVVISLEYSIYFCGHCLSFLLCHIFLLISMSNKKSFTYSWEIPQMPLWDSCYSPQEWLYFSYCVLISTFTLIWKCKFDNSKILSWAPEKVGQGESIQCVQS